MPYRIRVRAGGGLPPFRHDRRARCRPEEANLFVPDRYLDCDVAAARAVCQQCPLKLVCAAWGVEHDLNFGVYGGTTPDQRRIIAAGGVPPEPVVRRTRTPVPGRTSSFGHGPVAVFAAARDLVAGVPLDVVLARHGMSKNVVQRAARVLRLAPELVAEVEGRRMSMAEAAARIRGQVST